MKKIDLGTRFLTEHLNMFTCPICHGTFSQVKNHTLLCAKGHALDVSKQGTMYFLTHKVVSEYDNDRMWHARRILIQQGLFDPILKAINSEMPATPVRLLDIGCGEGTPLHRLENSRQNALDTYIGFDISKRAISLATQQDTKAFFCVADLCDLPFAGQSFDIIMDIFSPSAYEEFERVLKPHGKLLKVIPNENYLGELRRLIYPADSPHYTYSNQKVLSRFKERYPHAKMWEIAYQMPLSKELFQQLYLMTPMHWGADSESEQSALNQGLTAISVDVTLLMIEK